MTTQTPTNNRHAALDEGLLNQLAGEFFARLPGAASAASAFAGSLAAKAAQQDAPQSGPAYSPSLGPSQSTGGPRGAGGGPAPGASYAPSLGPAPAGAVPTGQQGAAHGPAAARSAAPAQAAHSSGHAQPYAASLPLVDRPAPLDAGPASPFYFVAEGRGYQSAQSGQASLDMLAAQALRRDGDRVSAQSFGLPGADQLRALLTGGRAISAGQPGAPARGPAPNAYYFEQDRAPRQAPQARHGYPPFDVHAIRRDFPVLAERVNGKPLAWFDNAATTHKPQAVIDRLAYFYAHENSNIHRAAHELAARATDAYEGARGKVARFLGAASPHEIIFVRGATEAINLVAQTFGAAFIGAGDEIIVSNLEHHANIVPWQKLAAEKGTRLRVIPVDDTGQVMLDEYAKLLNPRTKLVAVTQVSNALGTVTPVADIVAMAHAAGARALVDGAQAVSHMKVDVQALGVDFYVFSGHKVFGPTGIGVVYGKADLLAQLPPWQVGGNMIADVTFERTVYHAPPTRFEAGTGNIADAVGLGAALDYLDNIGLDNVARYEGALLDYATQHLQAVPGLRLIGTAQDKASVASFVLDGYKTEEVGKALNQEGIAVRTGHHCAQPILRRFGVEATVRPSFAFYNTCEEIDRMITVVRRLAAARR